MKKLTTMLLCITILICLLNISAYANETETSSFVTRLYQTCLNRSPDEEGFNYWVDKINSGTLASDIAYGFIFSKEFQNKNYTNEQYVNLLYSSLLNRKADAAGFQYWLERLALNSSRKDIFNGFIYSIEFKSLCESYNISQIVEYHPSVYYTPAYFKQMGVLNWGGSKWTYYSQRILPGYGLKIPGRHVDENGYVCDENDYIVLASDLSYFPRYTVVDTPFGKWGKIYDTGCGYGILDVYVDW